MSSETPTSIHSDDLTVSVPGRTLVSKLRFDASEGDFVAVLGKNGAGKSLTLHTLAGIRPPESGQVLLNGLPIQDQPRSATAQTLALLPQDTEDIFPATVMDTIMIGRHPHIGRFRWETSSDKEIAAQSLGRMDLDGMSNRDIATLSGGERRRVSIAQIMTQAPDIYLLDEPTNHLDPQHQLDVLQSFRNLVRQGSVVVASLHDVNLAARFADACLLLFGDGRWEMGSTESVLTDDTLSELYATRIESIPWRDQRLFIASGTPD